MAGYYDRSAASKARYYNSNGQTIGAEPNLRSEMTHTIDGYFPEIAKGQTVILRRVKHAADGSYLKCACRDRVTDEPDKDIYCPLCLGIGYYFEEEYIKTWMVLLDRTFAAQRRKHMIEPGIAPISTMAFYFEYDAALDYQDRIVQVELDTEGLVVKPLNYLRLFTFDKAWPYRCDNGKLEYWKVLAHEEQIKYLQAPTYGT